MHILIFNAGSSSLSYKVFDYHENLKVDLVFKGKAYRVGVKGTEHAYIENNWNGHKLKEIVDIPDHKTAACLAAKYIVNNGIRVDAVGHRFVHGGEYFKQSAVLDLENLSRIKECLPLAPLHNPIAFSVIQEAMKMFADIPHYVVIDSAFHSTMPPKAYHYPLPDKIIERFKFRRFGFHGISYAYICSQMPKLLNVPSESLNMIVCHLGTGGASVMAVKSGRSVDTSMGFSPNSGLIMSTRSGDIDPALLLYLAKNKEMAPAAIEAMLNNESGLRGICGFSSDITDIISHMNDEQVKEKANLAFDMYIHRLKSYIGSYVFALEGRLNALVFTDDIGVGNPLIRQKVCEAFVWAGIKINKEKNNQAKSDEASFIQSAYSKVAIVSIPTDEELMICLEGGRILGGSR
jgi:acetate kinase